MLQNTLPFSFFAPLYWLETDGWDGSSPARGRSCTSEAIFSLNQTPASKGGGLRDKGRSRCNTAESCLSRPALSFHQPSFKDRLPRSSWRCSSLARRWTEQWQRRCCCGPSGRTEDRKMPKHSQLCFSLIWVDNCHYSNLAEPLTRWIQHQSVSRAQRIVGLFTARIQSATSSSFYSGIWQIWTISQEYPSMNQALRAQSTSPLCSWRWTWQAFRIRLLLTNWPQRAQLHPLIVSLHVSHLSQWPEKHRQLNLIGLNVNRSHYFYN